MQMVDALSRASAPQQVLDAVIAATRKAYGPRCYLSLSTRGLAPGQFRITRWLTPDGDERAWTYDQWNGGQELPVQDSGILAELLRTPEPKLLQGINIEHDPVLGEQIAMLHSLVAVPILENGVPVNWTVLLHENERGLGVADLEQLVLRGNLLGTAVNNVLVAKRLREATDWIQHEVDHIAAIQRSLLPQTMPKIPGLTAAAWYDAYDRAGGDYYDIIPLTVGLDGQHLEQHQPWGIMIADASGHGPGAAVIVAMLHAILHAREPHTSSPGKLLEHLNQRLFARRLGSEFVTVFFGHYAPDTRELIYASAGHNPALLRSKDGRVTALDQAGGLPLGVDAEFTSDQARVTLSPGDTLLLYTDGISEAAAPDGSQFGTEKIEAVFAGAAGPPERVIEAISSAVRRHEAGGRPRDDRTMVVLQVRE
jgi:sigma-B regulation protein RsbU (phosphoserine phosphatase)